MSRTTLALTASSLAAFAMTITSAAGAAPAPGAEGPTPTDEARSAGIEEPGRNEPGLEQSDLTAEVAVGVPQART